LPLWVPWAVTWIEGTLKVTDIRTRTIMSKSSTAIASPETETSRDDYPLDTVMRIIKDAKKRPMSLRQAQAVDREPKAYGAKQAKNLGMKECDIPRIIHEFRAGRRKP
jgi:hypothetical protein